MAVAVSQPSFPYGREVVQVRQEVQGVDQYGNDVYGPTSTVIPGCVFWPKASTETDEMTRDTVESVYELLIPPDIEVLPVDTFLIDGETFEVTGLPFNWQYSPFTNSRAGRQVELQRITG